MTRLPLIFVLLAATRLCLAADKSPNILVIYADDLGYGDVHCYNPERSKIPTPNIDKLAEQGMRSRTPIPPRAFAHHRATRC